MTKDAEGVWSVTTPPAVPGFHYYWFVLDGVPVSDPASESYFGYGKETSGVEVPEAGADYYAITQVPHGEVRAKWYLSKTTGEWRRALVYTPPGYDEHRTRYPVLILQHGSGENETGWTRQGKAQFILDNLIAARMARPMIVVMDRGYATQAGTEAVKVGPDAALRSVNAAFSAFEDVIIHDLIPMIDASYRTIPDREHRAMAGLSMGGFETHTITLAKPDVFGYWGLLSGGNYNPAELQGKPKPKHIFISYGSKETNGANGLPKVEADLKAAGYNVTTYVSPGTAHEFQTWRRSLYQMAPMLFKD